MAETICMITSAISGIGKATALGLARMGATVANVARDRQRSEAVQAKVRAASGNPNVDLLVADLSSQSAVRRLTSFWFRRVTIRGS